MSQYKNKREGGSKARVLRTANCYKNSFSIVVFLFLFLFSFSLVSAVPPFETTATDGGIQFGYSPYETVKENTNFTLHLHVINSTGVQTNLTTQCLVHLYNSQGSHILQKYMDFDSNKLEFSQVIAAPNFTMGQHAYIIQCNNTNSIHLVSGVFTVTESGRAGIPIEWILVIMMVIAWGLVIFGMITKDYPPITMGALIMLILSLYIFINGFGSMGAKNLLPQLVAGAHLVAGAYLGIKSLEEA